MTKISASLGGAIPSAACVPTVVNEVVRNNSRKIDVARTEGGTNVQAVAFLVRYPVLVNADELLHQLNHSISIEFLGTVSIPLCDARLFIRTGNAIRCAVLFMRFMFMSGRNNVILPFTFR